MVMKYGRKVNYESIQNSLMFNVIANYYSLFTEKIFLSQIHGGLGCGHKLNRGHDIYVGY